MAITFERTLDQDLVRWVLTHDAVWEHTTEDGEDREAYQPSMDERICYITARDGEELLGLWMFVPQTRRYAWEVHTCLLPGHGARRGRRAARELAALIWKNTPTRVLIAKIPEYNRLALRFAKDVGFVEFGRDSGSYEHGGQVWRQVYLELVRPEAGRG
jgi:L-amino acid N-acyltransferase YncA